MAIVWPRALPASGAGKQLFDIQRVDFQSPEASGRVGGVQAGFPLWIANWELTRLPKALSDEWHAWLRSMRGSQKRFLGRDFARSYPRTYSSGFGGMTRAGGGSFTGAATSWSQTIDASGNALLTLNGLPAGFVLTHTDLIGFKWDAAGASAGSYGRRHLVSVVDPGTASGAGAVTVGIEPPVPSLVVPSGAVAHLDSPACVMGLVAGDTKVASIDLRLVITGTTVAAVQDLRA